MPKHFFSLLTYGIVMILLVTLHHFQLYAVGMGDFLFVGVLIVLGALYRPRIAFWFLIGLLPLEIINLAPTGLDIALRPYQILGGALFLAVIIRFVTQHNVRSLPRWQYADLFLALFVSLGFVSAIFATEIARAMMQATIVLSFFVLYLLARFFVQSQKDLVQPLRFFLCSTIIVSLYAIAQNWLFAQGMLHGEVMPGRPNAAFSEADWLGMFLVVVLSVVYATFFYTNSKKNILYSNVALTIVLFLTYSALFLTVARSAWLGALAVTIVFIAALLWQRSSHVTIHFLIVLGGSVVAAIAFITLFHLSDFSFIQRATSTTTGMQTITVSCDEQKILPATISSTEELVPYNCSHINLEDIAAEQARGHYVTKIDRPDPNVSARKEIYTKSWNAITENWLIGYGWGSSGDILGTDEAGTPLNASNIFLEIWLSVGLLGLMSFSIAIGLLAWRSIQTFFTQKAMPQKTFALFGILVLTALIIPNLFNAGLLMGFVWVALGSIVTLKYKKS